MPGLGSTAHSEPDHSPANLRLAHRWCNSVRGDESIHAADILLPPSSVVA